ncbi:MAG TPA: DUF6364 family protein [Fodinibius sp.]|nr:DUF6364 family protein [Fodinibius sp.]
MKEKLTLSIDKQTKKRAKSYAKATGHSISEMVEDFLNAVASEGNWTPPQDSIVAKLAGSLPIDDDRPYKEIITEEITEKYNINEDTD